MRRLAWLLTLVAIAFWPRLASAGPPDGGARHELVPGGELVAVRDVSLRQATLAKGSRVKVVSVRRKDGRPSAVDLELADGHVLRAVSYRKVKDAFRPAREG